MVQFREDLCSNRWEIGKTRSLQSSRLTVTKKLKRNILLNIALNFHIVLGIVLNLNYEKKKKLLLKIINFSLHFFYKHEDFIFKLKILYNKLNENIKKIPHTGDKESLDRCGQ